MDLQPVDCSVHPPGAVICTGGKSISSLDTLANAMIGRLVLSGTLRWGKVRPPAEVASAAMKMVEELNAREGWTLASEFQGPPLTCKKPRSGPLRLFSNCYLRQGTST